MDPKSLRTEASVPARSLPESHCSLSYLETFFHGVVFYGVVYMIPIYFQSIKDSHSTSVGYLVFPFDCAFLSLCHPRWLSVSLTGRYKKSHLHRLDLMAGGIGWMTAWNVNTGKASWAISQVIAGAGIGILFPITLPPVQASLLPHVSKPPPLPTHSPAPLALSGASQALPRSSPASGSQPSPVLPAAQSTWFERLQHHCVCHLPQGPSRADPGVVKKVYADAIGKSFWLFVPLCIVGFLATFAIKDLPLPDYIKSEAKFEGKEDALRVIAASHEVPSTMP